MSNEFIILSGIDGIGWFNSSILYFLKEYIVVELWECLPVLYHFMAVIIALFYDILNMILLEQQFSFTLLFSAMLQS